MRPPWKPSRTRSLLLAVAFLFMLGAAVLYWWRAGDAPNPSSMAPVETAPSAPPPSAH
jgi:hypothetical protein